MNTELIRKTLQMVVSNRYRGMSHANYDQAKEALAALDADVSKQVAASTERQLRHLGDEVHNAICAAIHLNEEIGNDLGLLASELWNWDLTHPPAKVPEAFYRIGVLNKAFDLPEDRRAYTYQAQPNNIGAARLGCAAYSCREQFKPDSTDQGLTLLQCLQSAGFGVFELSGTKEPS